MGIVPSEINLYKSQVVSADGTNGGRRSINKITSGSMGNAFDYLLPDDFTNGFEKTVKLFFHNDNDDDLTLLDPYLILNDVTPGSDFAVMYKGYARDTQSDYPSPRLYGTARLISDVSAGSSSIVVDVEDSSMTGIFASGDTVYIKNDAGTKEKHTIASAPAVSGTQVTITITGTLANSYTVAGGARLASAIEYLDLECSVTNWAITGSGTYNNTSYPPETDNLGTVEQTWTLEWLTATTFSCTGDGVGALADGVTTGDYSPINPDTGKPYFILRSAGHGGTHIAGDTIVFQTHGAEAAFYLQLTGPAGATPFTGNRVSPILLGATV